MQGKLLSVKTKDGVIIINPLHVSHISRNDTGTSYIWMNETQVPVTTQECDTFLEQFNQIMGGS